MRTMYVKLIGVTVPAAVLCLALLFMATPNLHAAY